MPSFGDELRRERELRRISLREIAEATKINVRYLDALERNEFEQLPGGVFNRGFVRAYSQYIGVDPEDMVNAYLLEEQGRSTGKPEQDGAVRRGTTDSGSKPPDHPPGGTEPAHPATHWSLAVRWTLAVVTVAALLVAAWIAWTTWGPQP